MKSVRALLLCALALVVPSCGQDINVPAPLLDEQFNGGFPGANWTAPATTGPGTTAQIVGARLAFTTTSASVSSTTRTQASFTNPDLIMDFQVAIHALAPGDQGAATVDILNNSLAVVASMTWDSPSTTVTYQILGTTVATGTAPPSDGTLNGFRFEVSSTGQAGWYFSNALQGTTVAIPAGPLYLQIGASFGTGTAWPEVDFDTITVTRP